MIKYNTKWLWQNSLEVLSLFMAMALLVATAHTFIVGGHYIIPTFLLLNAMMLINLVYFSWRQQRWAKYLLLNIFWLALAHCVFALFWAKTPRDLLGDYFTPTYGSAVLILTALLWKYRGLHGLYPIRFGR